MLRRRSWLKGAVALLAAIGIGKLVASRASLAQEGFGNNFANSMDSARLVKLEDQLRYGLRCVTPSQIEYVGMVSTAVDQGRIPRAMVNLVYRWSIEKNPSVPFPYFQFALRELAKRRGINLP